MNIIEFKERLFALAENPDCSLREIQALITRYFKHKAIPHLQSDHTFIVRASINDPGEVFKNVSRCSYPPDRIKPKIKIQRANYPEQQVFYCTVPINAGKVTATMTCVLETAWEYIEDLKQTRFYLTLSRWKCSRPLQLWVLPFSETGCKNNPEWRKMRDNIQEHILNHKWDSKPVIQALEFISEAFCKREDKQKYYRITSAFFNAVLFYEKFTNRFLDGLMYPSANTGGVGINIVLKRELVDTAVLTCDYVTMYSVQKMPNNLKEIRATTASNNVIPDLNGNFGFNYVE